MTNLGVQKPKERHTSKACNNLPGEIEKLRAELHERIIQKKERINSEEMLALSRKLDELIVKQILDEMGYRTE